MSMNLVFLDTGGGILDFPYQTRTELSYAVLDADSEEEQLQLIREDVKRFREPGEDVERMMSKIRKLLRDPGLTLGVI